MHTTGTSANAQLVAALQPIWCLRSNRPVGFEALARSIENDSILRADDFLLPVKEAGRIAHVDEAVMRYALAHAMPDNTVFVNITPSELAKARYRRMLLRTIDYHKHPASHIVFELTEEYRVEPTERLLSAIGDFRARGIRIALDDAIACAKTLELISAIKPDFIKVRFDDLIDARFVAALDALQRAGQACGAFLIAEAIETPQSMALLREREIEYGQGYLFGYPAIPCPTSINKKHSMKICHRPL